MGVMNLDPLPSGSVSPYVMVASLIFLKCAVSEHGAWVFNIGISEIFLYGLDIKQLAQTTFCIHLQNAVKGESF